MALCKQLKGVAAGSPPSKGDTMTEFTVHYEGFTVQNGHRATVINEGLVKEAETAPEFMHIFPCQVIDMVGSKAELWEQIKGYCQAVSEKVEIHCNGKVWKN